MKHFSLEIKFYQDFFKTPNKRELFQKSTIKSQE